MWEGFLSILPQLAIAIVFLGITWLTASVVSRGLAKAVSRAHWRESLRALVRQLIYVTIWVLGLLIAANIAFPTMTPGKTLAALGLGSIAIGFAFKDIFENFFAGILILWRFPFENGDFIECGELTGRVESTTIRMTLVRKVDGELVAVPNSFLFKNAVTVLTDRDSRRIRITCGVAYDEDVDAARRVISDAVASCDSVDSGTDIQVFAQAFGASSIDFEVAWWTGATPLDQRQSRDQVIGRIKRALDDAGIEIPFPYRTLTFKEPLSIRQQPEDTTPG